ncbi:restriction endonuclease subunit S [Vibrio splendidus]|uniref:restriction endonuclease subunit S n=1 Tax=Vibrio splendidus TaxID=29497 RepID=UPI00038082FB|nr:restriction endonuclease subunit S [Vibrio splendidus]
MSNAVPDGWKSSTLSDISKVSIGLVTSMTPFYVDDGVPLIRNSDIKENKVRQTKLINLDPSFAEKNKSRSISYRDIVTVHTGDIGTSAVVPKELDGCQGFATLNTKVNESIIDPYYLCWFFNTETYTNFVLSVCTGDGRNNLNLKDFVKSKVAYPPLPEQKKIAAILTSVDDVIEKTQAQIDKLKDLKAGMMQELLTQGVGVDGKPHTEFKDSPVGRVPKGWEVEIFGDVFDLKNGVNKGKEFFGSGVPIISYRNVYDGNGIYDYMLSNKVEMTEGELERFKVRKGDVFITRTSETPDEIGFTNVYLGDLDNVVFNGFVIRARQKTDIFDCDYSKYAFQADYMRQQMIHSSKFTTRAGISGESLSLLKVIVPPLIEQQKIGKAISSVDARINSLIKLRDSKSSLKKALMQDLLTGKVRVKVEG